eukprot:CAMPEP_0194266584 /NCGR_PEP_ID=MMETSP0169-20130528/1445_1 /TAXON_ID=218684 /ORGANISM="Corethron pennatum, Strain L29A3" /LENGTH=261 /DNA_ID=CAMNT_0039007303 /DNA_START=177 /DNA_END=962 /DNA_ORIENTATION=+
MTKSVETGSRKRKITLSAGGGGKTAQEAIDVDDDEDDDVLPKMTGRRWKIYCDLDGVLVDFEKRVRELSGGKGPSDMPQNHLWATVARDETFYEHLPWTADGRDLWAAILPLRPDILTGVPMALKAREQKARWCRRELPAVLADSKYGALGVIDKLVVNHVDYAGRTRARAHEVVTGRRTQKAEPVSASDGAVQLQIGSREVLVNVLTCWSRNKHCESGPGCVLIDDTIGLRDAWVEAGGIFVHHTDTENTLSIMKNLEIL